ncbi:Wee1-like protein kinase [Diplonema papillatum]|nr:Wee1-like protein kinase [Diplonema papillatum]|eukprot:gene1265-1955_t
MSPCELARHRLDPLPGWTALKACCAGPEGGSARGLSPTKHEIQPAPEEAAEGTPSAGADCVAHPIPLCPQCAQRTECPQLRLRPVDRAPGSPGSLASNSSNSDAPASVEGGAAQEELGPAAGGAWREMSPAHDADDYYHLHPVKPGTPGQPASSAAARLLFCTTPPPHVAEADLHTPDDARVSLPGVSPPPFIAPADWSAHPPPRGRGRSQAQLLLHMFGEGGSAALAGGEPAREKPGFAPLSGLERQPQPAGATPSAKSPILKPRGPFHIDLLSWPPFRLHSELVDDDERVSETSHTGLSAAGGSHSSAAHEAPEDEPEERILLDYQRVKGKKISRGAFGEVQCYRHKLDGRLYAIKRLASKISSAGDREVKFREARLLASLRHAHVARYHSVWVEPQGHVCVAQEWCDGGSASAFRKNKPSAAVLAALVSHVASALAYIHSRGLVHLDVKIDNVLIKLPPNPSVQDDDATTLEGQWENVTFVLGDFGMCREVAGLAEDGDWDVDGDGRYVDERLLREAYPRHLIDRCDVYALGLSVIEVGREGVCDPIDDLHCIDPQSLTNTCGPRFAGIVGELLQSPRDRPSAQALADKMRDFSQSQRASDARKP